MEVAEHSSAFAAFTIVASLPVRQVPIAHGFGRFGEEVHEQRERAGGLEASIPGEDGQVHAAVQVVHEPGAA